LRAVGAEFLGTFALVFFGCGAIANSLAPSAVAMAFGLVIAGMIYAVGHISGAHFNPAVSIAFAFGGHTRWPRVGGFVAAQTFGAIVAAFALRVSLGPEVDLGVAQPTGPDGQAFAWEVVLTFFLMLVITAVATDIRAVGQAAALAIGGTVALGALVGGPISGAAMNPARALGPALIAGDLTALWIYLTAPILGALAATFAYRWLRQPGPQPVEADDPAR
jgi:aquaporin NIP